MSNPSVKRMIFQSFADAIPASNAKMAALLRKQRNAALVLAVSKRGKRPLLVASELARLRRVQREFEKSAADIRAFSVDAGRDAYLNQTETRRWRARSQASFNKEFASKRKAAIANCRVIAHGLHDLTQTIASRINALAQEAADEVGKAEQCLAQQFGFPWQPSNLFIALGNLASRRDFVTRGTQSPRELFAFAGIELDTAKGAKR